jgi:hypothetical protein
MMTNTNEEPVPGSNGQTSSDMRQTLKEDLSGAVDSVKEQAGARLDQYKDSAADQLESLAQNAQTAAEHMQGQDALGLSRYVGDVARQMSGLADSLRNKNAEQLLHEAGRLARDNPLLFLAGSVVLGVGLSRLLKASSPSATSAPHGNSVSDLTLDTNIHPPHESVNPATLAAEEMVATHPHDHDVRHSARPGAGGTEQHAGTHRPGDLDDGLPGGTSGSGMPRGGM